MVKLLELLLGDYMKFANGTGSITKLSGKRRKPFIVRSPEVLILEDGKPKRKRQIIGYAATHKEALLLLSEYTNNPYDLTRYTVNDVWKKASPRLDITDKRRRDLTAIYDNYLSSISEMQIREVRAEHLQQIIDNCTKRSATKNNIRTVMRAIYDYAMSNDIVVKDYSQYIKYSQDDVILERELFTSEQVKILWDNVDDWRNAYVLILLYTGCRFSEIADNKIENLDLQNKTLYIPEYAAKNKQSIRTIPLHEKIIPLLTQYKGQEYVFERKGYKVSYMNMYNRDLPKINALLGSSHTFHDTRHTFTTVLKEKEVDLYYIDELVGHKHGNITEDVYTHARIEKMREALRKLDYFS